VIKAENFDPVAKHADDFRIEIVPRAGHFVAEEAADEVGERLLAFMSTG
jgi:pimeloyl-ACP methyl ester carboxylesterase